jgi:hypothetical protein
MIPAGGAQRAVGHENIGDVPAYPGFIMPSPSDLWKAYEQALVEIEHNRGRQLRADNYAREARRSAFSAFLRALSNSCSAIVANAHPNDWGRDRPTPDVPEVQALASGPGRATAPRIAVPHVLPSSE